MTSSTNNLRGTAVTDATDNNIQVTSALRGAIGHNATTNNDDNNHNASEFDPFPVQAQSLDLSQDLSELLSLSFSDDEPTFASQTPAAAAVDAAAATAAAEADPMDATQRQFVSPKPQFSSKPLSGRACSAASASRGPSGMTPRQERIITNA